MSCEKTCQCFDEFLESVVFADEQGHCEGGEPYPGNVLWEEDIHSGTSELFGQKVDRKWLKYAMRAYEKDEFGSLCVPRDVLRRAASGDERNSSKTMW
jgi:hypothetical protein